MSVTACSFNHSVTVAEVDLAIDNNGTWMDAFQFGTPGDTTWSLVGMKFEVDVQLSSYDAVPMLSMSTDNGRIVIDDADQRVIHFNVTPADLQAALTPGEYLYDLVMVDASNTRTPLMRGILIVEQGVTYPPDGLSANEFARFTTAEIEAELLRRRELASV